MNENAIRLLVSRHSSIEYRERAWNKENAEREKRDDQSEIDGPAGKIAGHETAKSRHGNETTDQNVPGE
jgi:hypothetical protein